MNNNYLKTKDNIKSININIIIALLPLIFAGFYKNGIKLYLNDLVSIYGLFKPLLFDIIGFLCGIIINLIYDRLITKKKASVFNNNFPIYGLLIASVTSINTNIFLYSIITLIVLFICKLLKNKVNAIALTSLAIIFISNLIHHFTYLNIYEQTNKLTLNTLDYLIGRGSGGINTTYILLLIISLVILCSNKYYKKEIPLYSTMTYILLITIYLIAVNKIDLILDNAFTNGILFSFIFITPESSTSSYTRKGKIFYSTIIGIITFVLYLFYPPLAALGGIVIASLCHNIIDKICQR